MSALVIFVLLCVEQCLNTSTRYIYLRFEITQRNRAELKYFYPPSFLELET